MGLPPPAFEAGASAVPPLRLVRLILYLMGSWGAMMASSAYAASVGRRSMAMGRASASQPLVLRVLRL